MPDSPLPALGATTPSAAAAPASPPSQRLVHAAHEFEAAMMKELLTPLTAGRDLTGGGDDDGSTSALSSFAGEALGQAISEHGGFGIARSILRELSHAGNHSGNASVPGKQPAHPPKSPRP